MQGTGHCDKCMFFVNAYFHLWYQYYYVYTSSLLGQYSYYILTGVSEEQHVLGLPLSVKTDQGRVDTEVTDKPAIITKV